jgi:dephospho-CoA kinase
MLKVGLTGGIASGKSTVASMLRDQDCAVLAMDPLGHELLELGQSAYDEVVREFGDSILGPGDNIDRAKLGSIVFADAAKRARLNQILHPRILDVVLKWFAVLDRPGGPEFAVVETALIVETGFHERLDNLVVCWSTPEQQMERLIGRGLTREQAQLRISSQMPAELKRQLADEVIDCSGSMQETERQVKELVEHLKQLSAS